MPARPLHRGCASSYARSVGPVHLVPAARFDPAVVPAAGAVAETALPAGCATSRGLLPQPQPQPQTATMIAMMIRTSGHQPSELSERRRDGIVGAAARGDEAHLGAI